jgi:two-component system, NarL family, nitrate/nitrite response regulator NarL
MDSPQSQGPLSAAEVFSPLADSRNTAPENVPNKSAPRPTSVPPESPQDYYISVLLISDVLLVRAGVRHVLEADGIPVVHEAATCEEALAKDERPDIILLDLDSRTETFVCVQDLVSEAESSRVIVLSDRHRAADQAMLIEVGAMGTVLKSEPPEMLIKAIRKVHAGEVWLDRTNTAQVLSRIARRRRSMDIEARKIASLTKREHEIIALIGEGLKNAAIGERLFISESTVRNHLTSILDKLGVSDRFELAVYAFKHGLVRYNDADQVRAAAEARFSR